jgi:hypothetical protein
MGLIIFAIVEYFLIMIAVGGAVWICLRYRKVAAGWKGQADCFQAILNDYELGRYQYLKLEDKVKPAAKDKKKAAVK